MGSVGLAGMALATAVRTGARVAESNVNFISFVFFVGFKDSGEDLSAVSAYVKEAIFER